MTPCMICKDRKKLLTMEWFTEKAITLQYRFEVSPYEEI